VVIKSQYILNNVRVLDLVHWSTHHWPLLLNYCTVCACVTRWAITFHSKHFGDHSSVLLLLHLCCVLSTHLATTTSWCSTLSTTIRGTLLNLHHSYYSVYSGSVFFFTHYTIYLLYLFILCSLILWSAVWRCRCSIWSGEKALDQCYIALAVLYVHTYYVDMYRCTSA